MTPGAPGDEAPVSAPPAVVVARLAALRDRLEADIPPKQLDRNLLVATWNVRAFGDLTKKWETNADDSPKRNFADMTAIAEIVSRFDVVALQEVRGNLRALRYLLKALGPDWGVIMSDVTETRAGNNERLAFVFDTRRMKPSGLAGEFAEPFDPDTGALVRGLPRQFARTPYAVSFASGSTTIVLVTLHVLYGPLADGRIGELRAIASRIAGFAREVENWGHGLITLGDFNIDRNGDPLYEAFTSTGLTPAPGLNEVPRTIFDVDGADTAHYYDQIAWFVDAAKGPLLPVTCTAAGGVDFVPDLQGSLTREELSFHISDHYPLWVEFALPRG